MDKTITNIIFSGVGGQGVLVMSDILAIVAMKGNYDVKKSEVHGMAQRGGSVISHLRFGDKIFSPLIPQEEADFIVSMEKLEALRVLNFLRPNGIILLNLCIIPPLGVLTGKEKYPLNIEGSLSERGKVVSIPALEIAKSLGNPRAGNVVMLGVLSQYLPFSPLLWEEAIKERFPKKYHSLNLEAFRKGREFRGK